MNRYFHSELESIRSKLILIGEKASEAGRIAVNGFLNSDMELTQKAAAMDDAIDELEMQIDHESVRYITLRSPVSSDVRLIMVAIKASHDLERAGDEAHSIAKKTRNILTRDGRIEHTADIRAMSLLAFEMMSDAITSLVEEDLDKAHAIIRRDKEVDRINKANFDTLSAAGANGNETSTATRVETILISKSIERIGDHAKNLAEEVIYLLTGE
ncbi:MAG: phosphate signaling complex protein PhoU [Verrucomicrobiota bacterium]